MLWRAFGRFPEEQFTTDGDIEWRFSDEVREEYSAPIPDGLELSQEECRYAGIPDDPDMIARLHGIRFLKPEYYQMLIDMAGSDSQKVTLYETEREIAKFHQIKVHEWEPFYSDYVDEFQAEICLKLRRGELQSFGTKLPYPNRKQTGKFLEEKDIFLDDLEVISIPKSSWVSSTIDWKESSINGRDETIIWIHVRTNDIIDAFPPKILLRNADITPLVGKFAIVNSSATGHAAHPSNRGRPALPWESFHVEVARLYLDQEMPEKKEAAIAHFQNWFQKQHQKEASRAAIGQKLKPYFDALGNRRLKSD